MALNQDYVRLAKAIRKVESGGNYEARGASGESGAYQFMPDTWRSWSKEFLGQENAPLTRQNQNKVAYKKIEQLANQGYRPSQIASIWNSGGPNWEGKRGTNKFGVQFDVPAYVGKVKNAYQSLKPQTAQAAGPASSGLGRPTIAERLEARNAEVETAEKERKSKSVPLRIAEGTLDVVGGREMAEGLGKSIGLKRSLKNEIADAQQVNDETITKLITQIREKRARGEDTTRLMEALKLQGESSQQLTQNIDDMVEDLPSNREVLGSAAKLAVTAIGAKVGGSAAAGVRAKGGNLAKQAIRGGTAGGAVELGGFAGIDKAVEGGDAGEVALSTLGGAVGGAVLGNLGARALNVLVKGAGRTAAVITPNFVKTKAGGLVEKEALSKLAGAWDEVGKKNKSIINRKEKLGQRLSQVDPTTGERTPFNVNDVMARYTQVPRISLKDGKIDVKDNIEFLRKVSDDLQESINPYLDNFSDRTISLDDFQSQLIKSIENDSVFKRTGRVQSSINEINKKFLDYRQSYGNELNPRILNDIKKGANQETRETVDGLVKNVALSIGNGARKAIDDLTQDQIVRQVNREFQEVAFGAIPYLEKLDGAAVGGGKATQMIARLLGATITSESSVPFSGLFGAFGGDAIVRAMRSRAFTTPMRRTLLRRISADQVMLRKIQESTTKANREYLERQVAKLGSTDTPLLPAPVNKTPIELPAAKSSVAPDTDSVIPKNRTTGVPRSGGEEAFGGFAGVTIEEDGSIGFDPEKAVIGVAGLAAAKKAGLVKGNKIKVKGKGIHPEDQKIMEQFIDNVRLRKGQSLELELDASRIAEHYGFKMPKSKAALANEFDKQLTSIREIQKVRENLTR